MTSHNKIRVALVGLNAPYEGAPTGTNWAASTHLPYLKLSDKYELVALQNSTVDRAAKAIKAYNLDPVKVKAYGTAESVANDPDIDLVVTCIRVDRHAGSLVPAIKAGKNVFVEWPIEANYYLAKELTDLVKVHNVRNVVGLQGRYAPIVPKVKAIIARGDIGKVESSTVVVRAYGGLTMPSHIDYFVDKDIGGNTFTIPFPHTMEFITAVLGEISTHTSLLVKQYSTVSILDPSTREVLDPARPNTVPNQVVFNAILTSDAVLTYKLHNGARLSPRTQPAAPGNATPALDWRIFGSDGELRITSYKTWSLNSGSDDLKLELYKPENGEIIELDVTGDDEFETSLPLLARNIARLYEAFATPDGDGPGYPDFGYALKKHELMEEMYRANGF